MKRQGGPVRQYRVGDAKPRKGDKHRLHLPTIQKFQKPPHCLPGVLWVLWYMWYKWYRFCIWQPSYKLNLSECDPDIHPLHSALGQLLITAVNMPWAPLAETTYILQKEELWIGRKDHYQGQEVRTKQSKMDNVKDWGLVPFGTFYFHHKISM